MNRKWMKCIYIQYYKSNLDNEYKRIEDAKNAEILIACAENKTGFLLMTIFDNKPIKKE